MMTCGCDLGSTHCARAMQLWQAFRAAEDIAHELGKVAFGKGASPILYDRWTMAADVKNAALRKYEQHMQGADEPAPEPQSLRVVS